MQCKVFVDDGPNSQRVQRGGYGFFKPTRLTIVFLAIFMSIVITGYLQNRYLYDNPQFRDSYYPNLYYVWMWLAAPLIIVGMAFHFGLGLDQVSFSELAGLLYVLVPTVIYFYLVSCIIAFAVRRMKSSVPATNTKAVWFTTRDFTTPNGTSYER